MALVRVRGIITSGLKGNGCDFSAIGHQESRGRVTEVFIRFWRLRLVFWGWVSGRSLMAFSGLLLLG